MDLLKKISKHHKEWLAITKGFGAKFPEDIVQDAYIRINTYIEKGTLTQEGKLFKNGKVQKGYMWMILRNVYYDEQKSKCNKLFTPLEYDDTLIAEQSDEAHDKLEIIIDKIDKETNKWKYFDVNLLYVYTQKGYSMRQIEQNSGKETTLITIFYSLKKSRERLKEVIGEDYEDYLNKDYELIN